MQGVEMCARCEVVRCEVVRCEVVRLEVVRWMVGGVRR